jgi:type I restriction enzyme, S subunit
MGKTEKLVPKLRFPGFEGAWEEIMLNRLLDFKNGINASKEQYGSGIKFINILDILNNDYILYDSIIGSVNVDAHVAAKYPVNYGDILFQRSSETREEVGTACVYLDREKTAVFGGFVIRGRKIGEYDPVFFNKLLKTDLARDAITSKSGGSTRYNVGQETLASVCLPFPTLPEQEKIAGFLSSVDTKLQQLREKKDLLAQYKKGLMQQLFSGVLRFKDDQGKDFPDWEEKRLGEVTEKINSGKTPLGGESVYVSEGVLFIRSQNVLENKFSKQNSTYITESTNNTMKNSIVKAGDILLNITGASLGRSCVVPSGFTMGNVNQHVCIIRLLEGFDPYFLQPIFASENGQNLFESLQTGSGREGLNFQSIKNITVAFPVYAEQQKIATFLSALDQKIETVATTIAGLAEWKKGLLQGLFV